MLAAAYSPAQTDPKQSFDVAYEPGGLCLGFPDACQTQARSERTEAGVRKAEKPQGARLADRDDGICKIA